MPIRRAISAVMPVGCDDETTLVQAVDALRAALAACSEEFEMILLDDAGGEAVGRLVDELAAQHVEVRAIHHRSRTGYGTSLAEGFLAARLPLVLQADAGSRVDLEALAKLIEQVDQHDLVVGRRTGRALAWPSRLRNWVGRNLAAMLFGVFVHDSGCPLKLFRRKVFKHITMASREAFIEAEILAKANALGYRIAEVPVAVRASADRRASVRPLVGMANEAWQLLQTFDLKPDPSAHRERLFEPEPE